LHVEVIVLDGVRSVLYLGLDAFKFEILL
jgi:hypothetical protein